MRVESRCAPIVMVPDALAVGAVDDVLVVEGCALERDRAARVIYIPPAVTVPLDRSSRMH